MAPTGEAPGMDPHAQPGNGEKVPTWAVPGVQLVPGHHAGRKA